MADNQNQPSPYEDRFFDLLAETLRGLDNDIKDVDKRQSRDLKALKAEFNKRLGDIETTLNTKPTKPNGILPEWVDPKLVGIAVACLFLLLSIIASFRGVKLP